MPSDSSTRVSGADSITDSTLSVAILGVGNIGSVHLQSVEATDLATVTAAADVSAANRRRASELGAAETYDDFRRLLRTDPPDVAVVAVPPSLHHEAAAVAMEAGCDVFVEKPLARSPEEAHSICAIAERTGATLGVDHTLRYQEDVQAVKAAYDEGRLGHVPLATIRRVNHGPFSSPGEEQAVADWQLDPELTGGGALLDLGVHLFDVLEWVFGECEVLDATLEATKNLPYEDTASVQVRATRTGTIATLQCGFFQQESPPAVNTSFRLEGVAESIDSAEHVPERFHVHALAEAAGNVVRSATGQTPKAFSPTYYYRAHYRALESFLTAVRDGRSAPVDGWDGLRALELVDAAYDTADDLRDEPPEELVEADV
jgi:predicted dehydrogenase